MIFILETRYDTGATAWRTEVEAEDLPSALVWAAANWHPAQFSRRADGRFNLNPGLFVDGVPMLAALDAHELGRAA